MKKKLLNKNTFIVTCGLILAGNYGIAQHQHFNCGPTVPTSSQVDLTLYEKERAKEIQNMQRSAVLKSGPNDTTYVIPIVFHIVHEYGSENISDAQVLDAVRILNEDYKKTNADTALVSSAFDTLIGTTNLEFRLAKLDPDGNCTDGIDRIYSHETVVGDDGSKFNPWPRAKYLNVWVVKSMRDGVAGYAYYPSATTQGFMGFVDGIIILDTYIGSLGTSAAGRSRALTHEIGHYLALAHTWGSTNDPGVACGDDGIADTPETKGWSTCETTGLDFCNPGIEENIQNYMEYSYCSFMFTKDQSAAMRAVLNSPIASRNNLWTPANLAETGVDNLSATPCAPIADFYTTKTQICKGQSVGLKDNSFNGTATAWNWSIPGGTPSTSTVKNPTITFNQAGWHNITLTASNQYGTNTLTVNKAVYVSQDGDNYSGLAIENFNAFTPSSIGDFYVSVRSGKVNTELPEVYFNQGTVNVANWELATDVGYSDSKSMRLDAHKSNRQMVNEFTTPSFNLTHVFSPQLTFKYATAAGTSVVADITESLKVYVSTNCGSTWQLRATITGLDLISAGFEGNKFKPSSLSQWKSKSISFPPSYSRDNVRFKFEYTSGKSSNDIYIDNIGIEGTLGLSSENSMNSLSVYPSPSASIADVTVEIASAKNDEITVQLFNSMGQLVASVANVTVAQGTNQLKLADLGFADVTAGVYLLKVNSSDNSSAIERLILQK